MDRGPAKSKPPGGRLRRVVDSDEEGEAQFNEPVHGGKRVDTPLEQVLKEAKAAGVEVRFANQKKGLVQKPPADARSFYISDRKLREEISQERGPKFGMMDEVSEVLSVMWEVLTREQRDEYTRAFEFQQRAYQAQVAKAK